MSYKKSTVEKGFGQSHGICCNTTVLPLPPYFIFTWFSKAGKLVSRLGKTLECRVQVLLNAGNTDNNVSDSWVWETKKSMVLPKGRPSPEVKFWNLFTPLKVLTLFSMVTQAEGLSLMYLSLQKACPSCIWVSGHVTLYSRAKCNEEVRICWGGWLPRSHFRPFSSIGSLAEELPGH